MTRYIIGQVQRILPKMSDTQIWSKKLVLLSLIIKDELKSFKLYRIFYVFSFRKKNVYNDRNALFWVS